MVGKMRLVREDTLYMLNLIEDALKGGSLESILKYDTKAKGRVRKALDMLGSSTIVHLVCNGRSSWFYVGPHSVHYIIPKTYCSCIDFNINVIFRGRIPTCYHLVVHVINTALGRVKTLNVKINDYEKILEEVIKEEDSRRLRVLLVKA